MTENHVLFSGKCPLRLAQIREFLPGPRTVEENAVGIVNDTTYAKVANVHLVLYYNTTYK